MTASTGIEYIAPASFEDMYHAATVWLRSTNSDDCSFQPVVISGISGAGKSRAGYEVFCRAKKEIDNLNVQHINYVALNFGRDELDNVADVVRIMFTDTTPQEYRASFDTNTLTMSDIIPYIARGASGKVDAAKLSARAALVLHLDEFHVKPELVVSLMDAMEGVLRKASNTQLVLIFSGIYTPEHPRFQKLMSKNSFIMPVGYFTTRDGAVDHEATWQITRNAVRAILKKAEHVLPARLDDAPPQMRFLVEDAGGWAYAAVLLGAEFAKLATLRNAKDAEQALEPLGKLPMHLFGKCEENVDAELNWVYRASPDLVPVSLRGSGIVKLISLILAPFKVWKC